MFRRNKSGPKPRIQKPPGFRVLLQQQFLFTNAASLLPFGQFSVPRRTFLTARPYLQRVFAKDPCQTVFFIIYKSHKLLSPNINISAYADFLWKWSGMITPRRSEVPLSLSPKSVYSQVFFAWASYSISSPWVKRYQILWISPLWNPAPRGDVCFHSLSSPES